MAPSFSPATVLLQKRDDNTVCARPIAHQEGELLSIGINTHRLLEYISGVSLGLTLIVSVFLITRHLSRFTVPPEQRQIVRIIFVPTFFAIISFISVMFYSASIYLRPVSEAYEAFCIPAMLMLYVHYVCPDEGQETRYSFFQELEGRDRKGKPQPGGSLRWFKRTWIAVFQFPLVKLLSSIIVPISSASTRSNLATRISGARSSTSPQSLSLFLTSSDSSVA